MKNTLNLILGLAIIALALWIIIKPSPKVADPVEPPAEPKQEEIPMPSPTLQFSEAEQVIKKGVNYSVTLTTSLGEITIKLDTTNTPITANNFVFLAQQGYYDQTIFHRTIEGFMIQGGDPTGTGSGSPGYRFDDEPFTGEYTRGTVAMANSGPNTNGGQFFIMHQDYPLPPNYVIFGHVIKGIEVVDQIATAPVKPSTTGENSSPINPVEILNATFHEN